MLGDFLKWTAWEYQFVEVFSLVHILISLFLISLAIFISYKLRNISNKNLDKILFGIGLFLLITEIYKQLFYFYVYTNATEYLWYAFPFQLCSIPMYLCLIVPFIKNSKLKTSLYTFLMSYTLLSGIIILIYPGDIIVKMVSITVHSFLWHGLIFFVGILLGFTKCFKKELKNFKSAFYVFLVLIIIALGINFMVKYLGPGGANMFFVGPNPSSLPVFDVISTKIGWLGNLPLYILTTSFGAFLVYYGVLKLNNK